MDVKHRFVTLLYLGPEQGSAIFSRDRDPAKEPCHLLNPLGFHSCTVSAKVDMRNARDQREAEDKPEAWDKSRRSGSSFILPKNQQHVQCLGLARGGPASMGSANLAGCFVLGFS